MGTLRNGVRGGEAGLRECSPPFCALGLGKVPQTVGRKRPREDLGRGGRARTLLGISRQQQTRAAPLAQEVVIREARSEPLVLATLWLPSWWEQTWAAAGVICAAFFFLVNLPAKLNLFMVPPDHLNMFGEFGPVEPRCPQRHPTQGQTHRVKSWGMGARGQYIGSGPHPCLLLWPTPSSLQNLRGRWRREREAEKCNWAHLPCRPPGAWADS